MARIEVKSEITGTVWKVTSKPGDKVDSGDSLVVIESMKMEIPVITEDPGTVTEILVNAPDQVYAERGGQLNRVDVSFTDKAHLIRVIQRMS